jgi:hypothetical protein
MKAIAVVLLVFLATTTSVVAQSSDFIRYYPAPVAGTSGGGGTFTAPVLLSDGTVAAPAIASASEPGTGFYKYTANYWAFSTAGAVYILWGSGGIIVRSTTQIGWSTSPGAGAADVILVRDAAAILQQGNDAATAVAQTLKGPDSTGATITGASLTLKGGAGTSGIANGGALILAGGDKSSTGEPGAVAIADGGTKPTCDAARRGSIWYDAGGAGVADTFEICSKSAADAYAWRSTSVLIP